MFFEFIEENSWIYSISVIYKILLLLFLDRQWTLIQLYIVFLIYYSIVYSSICKLEMQELLFDDSNIITNVIVPILFNYLNFDITI